MVGVSHVQLSARRLDAAEAGSGGEAWGSGTEEDGDGQATSGCIG